jgi:hypothetical protein
VNAQDMGMLKPGGHADLAGKPLGPETGGELGAEDLEGDRALVAEVAREVDGRHAAVAELTLEGVAAGEGRAKEIERVGQTGSPGRDTLG